MKYYFLEPAMVYNHLNMEGCTSDNDEFVYIELLMTVSEDTVAVHLGYKSALDLALAYKLPDGMVHLPAPIYQAMLLFVGQLYANREPVIIGSISNKLPLSYEYLLAPFIKYGGIIQ